MSTYKLPEFVYELQDNSVIRTVASKTQMMYFVRKTSEEHRFIKRECSYYHGPDTIQYKYSLFAS